MTHDYEREEIDDWLLDDDHPLMTEQFANEEAREDPPKPTGAFFCFACGTPWPDKEIQCQGCGGMDRAHQEARPLLDVPDDAYTFPAPWSIMPWPRQGTVVLFGGPGAGKSSLAGLLRPRLWLTKEQEPKPVGGMFRRILDDGHMPRVVYIENAKDVFSQLRFIKSGPVVIDSLTALGLREGLLAAELLVKWTRDNNDRCLAIAQVNKGEQLAGYMAIPHLFDAVINVTPDPWGVRSFRVTKSRWSRLGSAYWTFNEQGQIDKPNFPAAYSVEGEPGQYWLHPYPVRGATWSGLLAAAAADDALSPGTASAAIAAPYMPSGFLEPNDIHERRSFAKHHGLIWLSPPDIPTKD